MLAWKRNLSHTSASAVVAMLGGDADRGGLKSKDVVIRFEHLACQAQRLVSHQFYEDWAAQQLAFSLDASRVPTCESLEVHAYMGDATNEEAVEKSKVHVGFTWSLHASEAELAGLGPHGCAGDLMLRVAHSSVDVQAGICL